MFRIAHMAVMLTVLSACSQPQKAAGHERYLGEAAVGLNTATPVDGKQEELSGAPQDAAAEKRHSLDGAAGASEQDDTEEMILISLRHYSMSAAGIAAIITWLRSRAQQALARDAETAAAAAALASSGGKQTDGEASAPKRIQTVGNGGESVRLDLSGNGLRINDSEALIAELGVVLYLPEEGGGIKDLDLSGNSIGEHVQLLFPGPLKSTGLVYSPGTKLAPTHRLTRLKLSDVGLGESSAPALMSALKDNHTLTDLDLSKNHLGSACALALAESMLVSRPRGMTFKGLKRLNLSWNSIEGGSKGAMALLEGLSSDRIELTSLDLSWNPLRERGAVALGEALRRREGQGTLAELDLAHCLVSEGAACLLAALLVNNTQMTSLNLCGNPIGFQGQRGLFRLLLARHLPLEQEGQGRPLWIGRRDCSLTASSVMKLRVQRPDGRYVLDLSNVGDRAAALELGVLAEHLANQAGVSIDQVCKFRKLVSKEPDCKVELDPWPMQPWESLSFGSTDVDDKLYSVPQAGILEITFQTPLMDFDKAPSLDTTTLDLALRLAISTGPARTEKQTGRQGVASGIDDLEGARRMDAQVPASAGPADVEKTEMLSALANGYWRFSTEQACSIVCSVSASKERVSLILSLLPCITDLENAAPRLSALVNASELGRMQSLIGELYFFNPLRPMRRWRLNLKNDFDRVVALRLQELSARERQQRELSSLVDTSQWANGECWRNAYYMPPKKVGAPAGAKVKGDKGGKGKKDGKKDAKADKGKQKESAAAAAVPDRICIKEPAKWVPLPQEGFLELDYTASQRPKADTRPISDDKLEMHVRDVKELVRLILSQTPLHLPSCFAAAALRPLTQMLLPLPLSASQAVSLCSAASFVGKVPGRDYPDALEWEDDGEEHEPDPVMLDELKIQACLRAELLQRMFQNILDLENLFRLIWTKLSEQDCDEIAKRVGLLNIWNPLQPGCSVNLHLEIPDERRIAVRACECANVCERESEGASTRP